MDRLGFRPILGVLTMLFLAIEIAGEARASIRTAKDRAVEAVQLVAREPHESLAEICVVGNVECVCVMHGTPHPKVLAVAALDIGNFGVVDEARHNGVQVSLFAGPHRRLADFIADSNLKIVTRNEGIRNYIGPRPVTDVVGGRLTTVSQERISSEFHVVRPILNGAVSDDDRQIGSHLRPRRVSLVAGQLHQNPCDVSKKPGRDGGYAARMIVQEFSCLPDSDKNHVVTGAIFFAGIFVLLTIVGVQWGKN